MFQVSSEELGPNEGAENAIDGNIHTMWHSSWNGNDSERYIIIELDEPKYLSALQYVQRQIGNNGRIKEGQILVSMDGKNWTDVATITNWADSPDPKMAVFDEVIKSQYVKLVATENYGDGRDFITAAMINLFEDITQKEESETPPDEEKKPDETPEEIPTPDEEEKPDEISEETLIQDKGQTSNINELDSTAEIETLPKTGGSNNIILIMILGVCILVVIFYIKMKTNLFRISKN